MFDFAAMRVCPSLSRSGRLPLLGLALAGLVAPPALAAPLEVDIAKVKGCAYLGQVEGSSGYGKSPDWRPLARRAALDQAGDKGASHVVLEGFQVIGSFNGSVTARAYRCSS